MTKQTRRKYDASFKKEAIRMADQSTKSDHQIEIDLGISQGAIWRWRKDLHKDPQNAFPGTGHQTVLEEENRRLKSALNDAVMERDILKKAIAIFSKTQKTNSSL